jgi:hypothetical protein
VNKNMKRKTMNELFEEYTIKIKTLPTQMRKDYVADLECAMESRFKIFEQACKN